MRFTLCNEGSHACNVYRFILAYSLFLAASLIIFFTFTGTSIAGDHSPGFSEFSSEEALQYSQSAVGRIIGNYNLVDQFGRERNIQDFLGKPLIVSFIYTSCYHTCPVLTTSLKNAVKIAREKFPPDSFSVISVGFDTDVDTPERMNFFAEEHNINDDYWSFLSSNKITMQKLTADLGFIFFPSTKGFDHLAQITIIDKEGLVYRQVYGETIDTSQIIEPLEEIILDKPKSQSWHINDWINNIRLFCTIYDPSSGRYIFDYSILITIMTGVLSLGALLVFLVHLWRAEKVS